MDLLLRTMNPGKTRFYRFVWEHDELRRSWWAEGAKKPTQRVTDLSVYSSRGAAQEFDKALETVLRRGYCRVGDADAADSGEPILEFMDPRGFEISVDISPDSRTLVVASRLKGNIEDISLVDIASGRRRSVHRVAVGHPHTFTVRAALFHPDGHHIVYTITDQTLLLDPDTGRTTVLADVKGEPLEHGMVPSFSRNGERLVVFDADSEVRVLDAYGGELFATRTNADGFTRRCAALSPSGRKLLIGKTKGFAFNGDAQSTFELYDVDSAALLDAFGGEWEVGKVGFDPGETVMVVNEEFHRGPVGYSLRDGKALWSFTHPDASDFRDFCGGWDYSPDGATMAIGRHGPVLVDAETLDISTRLQRPCSGDLGLNRYVVFSPDGSMLATACSRGRVVVWKL